MRLELAATKEELHGQKTELQSTMNVLHQTQQNLMKTQTELAGVRAGGAGKAKANRPGTYTGRGSKIEVWVNQMETYLKDETAESAFSLAITYLEEEAFAWFESFTMSTPIHTWPELKEALVKRFSPLDKTVTARDKLHTWCQRRDVASFNAGFLNILLDIPNITEAEKMDRYTRGLKGYIWEALCTKTYHTLEEIMTDALRVENAKRGRHQQHRNPRPSNPSSSFGPTPMDLSSTSVQKLTPDERERCMREGRCLRCREMGHMARDCPKGQRRVPPRGSQA